MEAPVPQQEARPDITDISGINALKQKVEALQFAQTEGPSLNVSAAEFSITQSTAAEGLVQEPVKGVEGLGQAQEAETPAPTGPEQKPTLETEVQAPTGEVARIPEKVANDPEYEKVFGKLYAEELQKGEVTDAKLGKIRQQAVSEYYDNWAKNQVEKGLPEETKGDPLYQQELGKVMQEAQRKGEPLDANKLSQEALSKYQQEKDLQAEEAEGSKAEQPTTDQSLEDVAQRLSDLLENNTEKLDLAKVTISAKDLALLLKALAEGKEPNPKKKENLLMLLLKLLGLLGVATVAEAGKQAQETTRQK